MMGGDEKATTRTADSARSTQEGGRGFSCGTEAGDRKAEAAQTRPEKDLKKTQDGFDSFRQGIQSVYHIPASSNCYIAGQMGVEVHVRVRSRYNDRDAKYFVARLRRLPNVIHKNLHVAVDIDNRRAISQLNQVGNQRLVQYSRCQVNGSVFIDVINPTKSKERFEGMQTPFGPKNRSHVERLELFELVGVGRGHVFPVIVASPLLLVDDDGKLDLLDYPTVGRFDTIEMTQCQLPGEVVEGAAKIVGRIPYDQAPVLRDFYDMVNVPNYRPLFFVELSAERKPFTYRAHLPDLPSKIIDVHFRAIKLRPTPC